VKVVEFVVVRVQKVETQDLLVRMLKDWTSGIPEQLILNQVLLVAIAFERPLFFLNG
jgi:hypothetical protein